MADPRRLRLRPGIPHRPTDACRGHQRVAADLPRSQRSQSAEPPPAPAEERRMLIGLAALAILIGVPVCGGRYAALATLRIRGTSIIMLAFAVQVAVISVFDIESIAVSKSLHVVSYLMLGVCL